MFWWCVGAVVGMAGIVVYMELGLTLPLYRFDGVEISVPRSGGELNYVSVAECYHLIHVLTEDCSLNISLRGLATSRHASLE
jgi:hypothetical protein